MPNYCNYRMVVIGYPNNVGNFLQVINNPYNYGNIYFFKNPTPHLYRVFETNIDDYGFYNDYLVKMELSGYCAWSVMSCMMEGTGTYYGDYHGDGWDPNKPKSTIDYINAGTSLIQLCRNLNLYLECYSDEPGMGFQEHYIINNFGNVIVDEEADNVASFFVEDFENEEEFKEFYPNIPVEVYRNAKETGGFVSVGGFVDIYGDINYNIINEQHKMCNVYNPYSYRYGEVNNMVEIITDINKDRLSKLNILERSKEFDTNRLKHKTDVRNSMLKKRKDNGYYE